MERKLSVPSGWGLSRRPVGQRGPARAAVASVVPGRHPRPHPHRGGPVLNNGDRLPAIAAEDLDGNRVDVADLVADSWAAVLLYRGHW